MRPQPLAVNGQYGRCISHHCAISRLSYQRIASHRIALLKYKKLRRNTTTTTNREPVHTKRPIKHVCIIAYICHLRSANMSSATSHLESLEPLIPILNAFIHRHKNQHGRSHWFRFVPILRRSLRSLLNLANHTTSSAKPSSRKASKEDAQLQRHAKWLHAKVIPRCFL
jgi:hypothetical protein